MRDTAKVLLPSGLIDGAGMVHRQAVLRALRGRDEEWYRDIPPETTLARTATELLVRGLRRIGPYRATRSLIRALPIPDRDYLLLRLGALTFGGRVEMVVVCPQGGCGSKLDVDFALDAIPVESLQSEPSYRFLPGAAATELMFRLPCGADQEQAGDAHSLLARCILNDVDVSRLSANDCQALIDEIERVSAKVPSELDVSCPHCGHSFAVPFDAASAICSELEKRRGELDEHVHLLSLYYHWPLSEILALTSARRASYVRKLTSRLEES